MPPSALPYRTPLRLLTRQNPSSVEVTLSQFSAQWSNPADILSVLMLVGPDIVQKAVAQLAGRTVTPLPFSFGCVAYSAIALMAIFGDGRLMPDSDVPGTMVVDVDTGHVRTTKNWVLGRLLRDMDDRLDKDRQNEEMHVPPKSPEEFHLPPFEAKADLDSAVPNRSPPSQALLKQPWDALQLSVYEVDRDTPEPHGVPTLDRVWYIGFVVILVQLLISIIPWILHGQWGAFMITAAGNLFALVGASLPQWRSEKWACPRNGGAPVVITQGNGSRHAVVILNNRKLKKGLDLEILARGTRTSRASRLTSIATAVLTILWIALLITVAGLEENTWYVLGIGLLGSIQNLFAAGAPRQPAAFGIHIKHIEDIRGKRIAPVLKEAERKYPGVGVSLLDIFFPGGLRVQSTDDIEFWRRAMDGRLAPNAYGTRVDHIPPAA